MVVAGVVGLLLVIGFTGMAASYGGVDYRCLVEAPFRTAPPFPPVSEAVEVHGYMSLWPFGRACDWERADGAGFVTAGPDWIWTIAALFCAGLAIAGRVLLDLHTRRPDAATPGD
jgi:hypothetical protein